MDTTVKRIRPKDFELATVQDNLAASLQQVLDFINKNGTAQSATASQITLSPLLQRLRGPGTPQSIQAPALLVHGDPSNSGQDVVTIGDPATSTASAIGAQVGIIGAVKLTGPFSMIGIMTIVGQFLMTGNTTFRPTSAPGVVIIPADAGVGFSVRNAANTADVFSVTGAGVVSIPSFSSATGFKNTIHAGTHWNSGGTANTVNQIQGIVANGANGTLGTTPFYMKWPYAGSVVGMSMNQAGPVTGSHFLLIIKNGATLYTWACGAGNNNTTFWTAISKGTIPFAAGDTMTCQYYVTAAGNTQVNVYLTLEMAA